VLDMPLEADDPGEDLRPAEVDADDAFSVQTARLPYWLDDDGREALPRLPRRAREGTRAARAPAGPAGPERGTHAAPATRAAPAPALELEAAQRCGPPRSSRPVRRLGAR